jgi:hypothetical protein
MILKNWAYRVLLTVLVCYLIVCVHSVQGDDEGWLCQT